MTAPDLLAPTEVAAMFRVDPKTVTRWAKSGRLRSLLTLLMGLVYVVWGALIRRRDRAMLAWLTERLRDDH